ncbi:pyruvate:ferredoxin (flavodoxin) oxidoreductase [Alkalimarinus sediminis]|uniref:Pyruvate-flavodoxin oxidoreductase n=1 Tax=Alkalimarinus sediminis TaxID=1632866 RepID=A0A9E8KKJ6_9ALTE|nr:pyruvate:ferredoxin (flavodoxin) oxidoreductase [Alkalimarinus sediminis]UZW76236.1 pyruvate:ferredoxin (flavodoxin) oxidoreductase [Alkalimarinus sediminis]
MNDSTTITVDGNEAVARVAHQTNEVIAIYPITPASPMGEHSDAWSAMGKTNIWGGVPYIVEMQSEAGAAGAIHGALQAGSLTTTFTASQGLLLMIPNMYKIAGELTPTVFHVAARAIAAQALSIFADHSDVMATRATGFGLLASNSVQEAHDMALIAQAASLKGRVPLLHFFDGFRTSHEIAKINLIGDSTIKEMLPFTEIEAFRRRSMSPAHPDVRGTSQNPDLFFQGRETVNPRYNAFPDIVTAQMNAFAALTGRQYKLFDYVGHPKANHIIVVIGSASETVEETVNHLNQQGDAVGLIKVRLYRPFATQQFLDCLPDSVASIAVLDRTKEPGADGEPLYKDVCTALFQRAQAPSEKHKALPTIIGGRYGLGSKEFTPAMVKAIFDELKKSAPKTPFTIGIHDDLSHTSLDWDERFQTNANSHTTQCVFFGLGADGTVSANKSSIKIIGENTPIYAQGYFVYDSKKSGAVTISHLRFGPTPIRSTYLIPKHSANYVGCHQSQFLEKYDVLGYAAEGAVFVLNSAVPKAQIWQSLPATIKHTIVSKKIRFYVIDAYSIAEQSGMGRKINTVMQTCFFAISNVLPQQEAISAIKTQVEKTYGKKGRYITKTNFTAIDNTVKALYEVSYPSDEISKVSDRTANQTPTNESSFVDNVTKRIIAGEGDLIPVSLLPEDGVFPSGTAKLEKRNLALELPLWDETLCTHCGKCVFVCPHSVIRSKAFEDKHVVDAPKSFKHVQIKGKDYPDGINISYQISPEDCTGCTLCVDICPIRDKSQAKRKAINMVPQEQIKQQEIENWDYFQSLPDWELTNAKRTTMKGAMVLPPMFEFSGACTGCGETPYIRLATQLFGDRMLVANATGCSSIYGGNLPTTPWSKNSEGRGPAWNNSLFEDNAEFGLGLRVASDQQKQQAQALLHSLQDALPTELYQGLINADESDEVGIYEQRQRIDQLKQRLQGINTTESAQLLSVADALSRKSVWIIGGDGWAYDIGFGGVDHVLASGKDVNILVLDTEVYSNTGGQTSKATPKGAVAKFSASGKPTVKKDLARIAMTYENCYVAHVAYGAKDVQTLRVFLEAEAYPGPSLIIAYSPCIAHGVDLVNNHRQQKMAVDSGHWPLFRYDPRRSEEGQNPLHLDSKKPSLAYSEFTKTEARFSMLKHSHPAAAEQFGIEAQDDVHRRYEEYQRLATMAEQAPTKLAESAPSESQTSITGRAQGSEIHVEEKNSD